MSTWNVKPGSLDERADDYTATFLCTNTDTEKTVTMTVTQGKGKEFPASDLVGACVALAQLFAWHARGEDQDETESAVGRLH